MDDTDPFSSITNLCHVSSSQEQQLNRCRFALEPDDHNDSQPISQNDNEEEDSAEIPIASTGIIMLSAPETPQNEAEQNDNNTPHDDIFRTPPEEPAPLTTSQDQPQQVSVNYEEIVALGGDCTGYLRAVDLGRDTDLGFSYVDAELTERIVIDSGGDEVEDLSRREKEVIDSDSVETRVSKRELLVSNDDNLRLSKKSRISDDSLGTEAEKNVEGLVKSMEKLESPLEKLRIVDDNLGVETPRGHLGSEAERILDILVKSMEKLKSPSLKKPKNWDKNSAMEMLRDSLVAETEKIRENLGEFVGILKSQQSHRIEEALIEMKGDERESREESSVKRKLRFSSEVLESDFEEHTAEEDREANRVCDTNKGHSMRKIIDDIDKFQYVGPTAANPCEKEPDVIGKRTLPMSMCGNKEVGHDVFSWENDKEVTLLDVLRMLAEDCDYDRSLENLSVLEAAKRRGMTFP